MKKIIIISLISLFTIGLVLGVVFFQKGVEQGAKLGGVEKLIEPEIMPQEVYQVRIPESKEECLAEIGNYSPKELMGAINFLALKLTGEKRKELYESIFVPFLDTVICRTLINQTEDNYLMAKNTIEKAMFSGDYSQRKLNFLNLRFISSDLSSEEIISRHNPIFKLLFYSQEKICPKGKEIPGIKDEWSEYAEFLKIDISKEKPTDFFDNYCTYLDKYKKDKKAFEKEVLGSEGKEQILFSPRFARILAYRLAGEEEALKICDVDPECSVSRLKQVLKFQDIPGRDTMQTLEYCNLTSINDDDKLMERLGKIKNLICEIRAESAPEN